jgi:hypothetical protein
MWELLVLVMLDGREAYVNPRQIISIVEAKDADDKGNHYTNRVKCVVTTVDGAKITTEEECDSISQRLMELAEKRLKEMRK